MLNVSLSLLLALVAMAPSQGAVDLDATVANLGSFDFDTRTEASRTMRRLPTEQAVRALETAAASHRDEYVRFRALVLLSGIDTGAMSRVAAALIGDRNDRIRTAAYQWFEHHPQPAVVPRLLAALSAETSEFVRPALTRALAANADTLAVREALRPLVLRGEDAFRGSLIAALGDYRGAFAVPELLTVVKLDGPLQDDAATALARIGDPSARPVIASLQAAVPRERQPTVSAALCLLGIDCEARIQFVVDTLRFAAASDAQLPILRGAVYAAGVLAGAGHDEVSVAMIDAALASNGGARDTLTLGVGTVILRDPIAALDIYQAREQSAAVAELFRDAFDMLSEDFAEEQFGTAIRREFWASPEGAARRESAASLLDALEF